LQTKGKDEIFQDLENLEKLNEALFETDNKLNK
jgi:hypothetical protein